LENSNDDKRKLMGLQTKEKERKKKKSWLVLCDKTGKKIMTKKQEKENRDGKERL
jgi:hypothetical protein